MNALMKKHVHFIGIGGIGMSALAQYFKAQKWSVSGSDAVEQLILAKLRKARISVKIGHKKGNLPVGTSLVVINQAIRKENIELAEARRRGVRILTYPEALGELTEQYRTIALAGAHGKSTTTALTALILIRGGLDPTVIVGTMLREFGNGNFRAGRAGGWLVLEADEFGNAFSHYSPAIAAITNIDREHLDVFKDLSGVKKAFVGFMENITSGGMLVLNGDDKNLRSLRAKIDAMEKHRGVRVVWYSNRDKAAAKIRRVIKIPGEHYVTDALAAYNIGRALGIPDRTVIKAIASYRGAWRRMEFRGRFGETSNAAAQGGALVYDDYAHHPTEIRATLKALKEKYPQKKILCVFQPHQAKRLEALFREFSTAFDDADEALVLPIYKVAGRDAAAGLRDSEALVRAIQKREPKKRLFYLADPSKLKNAILAMSDPDGPAPLSRKVIVMMGAGDIVNMTDSLLDSKKKI